MRIIFTASGSTARSPSSRLTGIGKKTGEGDDDDLRADPVAEPDDQDRRDHHDRHRLHGDGEREDGVTEDAREAHRGRAGRCRRRAPARRPKRISRSVTQVFSQSSVRLFQSASPTSAGRGPGTVRGSALRRSTRSRRRSARGRSAPRSAPPAAEPEAPPRAHRPPAVLHRERWAGRRCARRARAGPPRARRRTPGPSPRRRGRPRAGSGARSSVTTRPGRADSTTTRSAR